MLSHDSLIAHNCATCPHDEVEAAVATVAMAAATTVSVTSAAAAAAPSCMRYVRLPMRWVGVRLRGGSCRPGGFVRGRIIQSENQNKDELCTCW